MEIGGVLALPDGTRVEVIGVTDHIEPKSPLGSGVTLSQTVVVGSLWSDSPVTPRPLVPYKARVIGVGGMEFAVAFAELDDTMPDDLKRAITFNQSMKVMGVCSGCNALPTLTDGYFKFVHEPECPGSDETLVPMLIEWSQRGLRG